MAIAKLEGFPNYRSYKDGFSVQRTMALDLHHSAGVPLKPCGIEEMKLFQAALPGYQLVVVSKDHFNAIIYKGPETENPCRGSCQCREIVGEDRSEPYHKNQVRGFYQSLPRHQQEWCVPCGSPHHFHGEHTHGHHPLFWVDSMRRVGTQRSLPPRVTL